MAVIMTRFCCCQGANLRYGSLFVGVLSLIGSGFLLAMAILSVVWTHDHEGDLHNPNATEHFDNRTIEHWEETADIEYLNLTMDLISFIVAGLLIYGTIKRIRPLLYTYIVWTLIIVFWSFGSLVYMALDGPRFVIAIFIFNFGLLLATAIYFILVVYSYSELIREGGDIQAVPQVTMVPPKEAQGQSNHLYSRFENQDDPGMGDDREVLTA